MVKKNYFHNVIRLRKGKPSVSQVYWIIVILNSKKESSHKQIEQLGFFRHGPKRLFTIDYDRLSHFLNKGCKLKNSVMKFIYWHTFLFKKKKKKKSKKSKLKNSIRTILKLKKLKNIKNKKAINLKKKKKVKKCY